MGRRDEEFEDDEEFMDDEEGQEDSLSGALAQQWGAAPWYVSSFGIHVVVFLIMLIFAPPPRQKEDPPIVVQTTLAEPPEDEPEEEEDPPEIPDPQDVTEIDIVLDPQVVAEVDIEVEITEEAVDDPVEGDPSEFDTMSDDIHSPALMGIGSVGGAGGSGGNFGSRTGRGKGRALRRGGGQGTEDALDAALRWLAHHQEENGSWNCSKYEGGEPFDGGVTGLATLAFLANGNMPSIGRYSATVDKALKWIDSQQCSATGHYDSRYRADTVEEVESKPTYQAAMLLMAMTDAYGFVSSTCSAPNEWRRNVQRAVDAAIAAQGPTGGWRYGFNNHGDMSVSGWWMLALKNAKEAGLNVPDSVFQRAENFFRSSAVRISGGSGDEMYVAYYVPPIETSSGIQGGHGPYNYTSGVATASLMTGLQFLGVSPHDPMVQGAAEAMIRELKPAQFPHRRMELIGRRDGNNLLPASRLGQPQGQDFYAWYYMSMGFFQLGANSPYWQKFNPLMKKELLETQRKDGTVEQYRGSWNPNEGGYWGAGYWGRVGQTATGALMLSVYYRYARVHQSRGRRR